jgi:crotonobetainyl-CoA:carnitine CoA-transferase CaiB-like acyl-CoA transferase
VYDNVIQTYSGIADAQTDPQTGEPGFVRQLLTDKLTAWAGAQAVCAALLAAARGRGGQQVELSMLDTSIAFLFMDAAADRILLGEGVAAQPGLGSGFALTRLNDGFGTFTPFSDAEFQAACRALDAPELASDPELATTASRMRNYSRWMDAIAALKRNAARFKREEFEARLDAQDVPHGVVRRLDELHLDPQVVASGVFVERDHPQAGRLREPRPPAHFRGTPGELGAPAPALGQHTGAILAEYGFGAREAELRAAGIAA